VLPKLVDEALSKLQVVDGGGSAGHVQSERLDHVGMKEELGELDVSRRVLEI
jgi:hypothetical protein